MTPFAGKDFVVEVETSPGVYQALPGEQHSGVAIANQLVDTTTKTEMSFRQSQGSGQRTADIKANGVTTDINDKTLVNFLLSRAFDGAIFNVRSKSNGSVWISAPFQVSSMERSGDYNKADLYNVVFVSSARNTVGDLPSVSASFTQNSSFTPATVVFTSTVTGATAPTTYDWDFGDGSAHGTGATVTHTYVNSGTYNVVLTVTDGSGAVVNTTTSAIVILGTAGAASNDWRLVERQDTPPRSKSVSFLHRTTRP